jgi:hypothetical protein
MQKPASQVLWTAAIYLRTAESLHIPLGVWLAGSIRIGKVPRAALHNLNDNLDDISSFRGRGKCCACIISNQLKLWYNASMDPRSSAFSPLAGEGGMGGGFFVKLDPGDLSILGETDGTKLSVTNAARFKSLAVASDCLLQPPLGHSLLVSGGGTVSQGLPCSA